MTPQDALAKAIHVYLDHHDDDCGCDDEAATLVPLLADGWTVARKQDAADGQALRELDAAHGGTWSLHVVKQMSGTVGFAIEAWHRQTKVFGKPDDEMPDVYPTIAAAADACRAAIEATR